MLTTLYARIFPNITANFWNNTHKKWTVCKYTEKGFEFFRIYDKSGRYYIFKENAVMDYDLILDTYTIDIPEFVEKYAMADEEEKIMLNVAKIGEAINDKNYQYIYSKLDETFKNNNYPTVEELKEYMEQKIYENNKVGFVIDEKNEDIYIGKLKIQNELNNEVTNLRLIIQLKQGTDYVISFSEI